MSERYLMFPTSPFSLWEEVAWIGIRCSCAASPYFTHEIIASKNKREPNALWLEVQEC